MTKQNRIKTVLTLAAVAILALAIGQVQGAAITVPNGDFEQMYKPGSTTITVTDLGGWVDGVGPSTPLNSGMATFSDGSTGDSVDVPGWIGAPGWLGNNKWDESEENWNRQMAINTGSGDESVYAIGANGGNWAAPNGEIAVSAAPLGNVTGGIYTFTVRMRTVDVSNPPLPLVWDLLAGGAALTPASSVAPAMTTEFQTFSKTYDATSIAGHLGEPLTIQLGVGSPSTGGTQMKYDNVTLDVIGDDPTYPDVDAGDDMISWSGALVALDPTVVNNDTEPQGTLTYLWTAEPNGIGDPDLDVAITGADTENASVTITKTATGDVTVVTMTLSVTLEGLEAVTDYMKIDVYDNACVAALDLDMAVIDDTDYDENCITNFKDFALFAATWLDYYALIEPVAK